MSHLVKHIGSFAVSLFLSLSAAQAYAASPLAQLKGELTDDMKTLLASVIGEVEEKPRSLAQARRRAQKAAEQALSVMRSQGYYGAEIKASVEEFTAEGDSVRKSPRPTVLITPGPLFTFTDVTIRFEDGAAQEVKAQLAQHASLPSGEAAIAAKVVEAELRAVNYLKANGYPETLALPRKAVVDHKTKTLGVEYSFKIGDKTRFGEIKQTGSAYIIKSWPKRISPFEGGELFSDRQLNKLSNRVIATGVFDSATAVLEDEKTSNTDGTVTRNILLNIEQGKLNTVTGELGYSTSDGSGIDLTFERRNFIGYAQTLLLTATAKTNQTRFAADYNIPYFFREDRALDLGGEIAREDTEAFTGERVGVDALITQKVSSRLRVGLGAGLEASRFKENGKDVTAYLFDGLGRATYDSRNSILDPVKGLYIDGSAIPTYNFGNEDGLFTTVQTGISHYRSIADDFVLAGRVKVGTIFGADQSTVPLNRRFYGGGGGSVRGYGYQSITPVNDDGLSIGGRSITELSTELRYHGDSPFGGVVFVDAGSVARKDLPNLSDIRYGAGVGLRYFTSFAPLRADIAIPLNKREGDASFQVYISIGQAF